LKKALLILAALTLVLSGVAAVSAYEAHTINVKAKVENALTVTDKDWHLGTIFPEEFFQDKWDVGLSKSFTDQMGDLIDDQGRVNAVDVQIYAEWKPVPEGDPTPTPVVKDAEENEYYAWMGECVKIGFDLDDDVGTLDCDTMVFGADKNGIHFEDSGWTLVGAAPATCPGATAIGCPITLGVNADASAIDTGFLLYIGVDAPVFEGYYNPWTDVCPKPNGLDAPTWIIPEKLPDGSDNPQYLPGGSEMGLDIKIQVVDIYQVLIGG
jgi:hypothetical protein